MKVLLLLAIVLAVVCVHFTQGQSNQMIATYRGTTCSSSQNVANIYTIAIGICATTPCVGATYSGESYSFKTECVTTIPTSPSNGQYMVTTYSDLRCKSSSATTSSVFALDTCIPVNNQTYGSVKYIGCKEMVQYVDKNCATVQERQATVTSSCILGISIQCNGATTLSIMYGVLLITFVIAIFF